MPTVGKRGSIEVGPKLKPRLCDRLSVFQTVLDDVTPRPERDVVAHVSELPSDRFRKSSGNVGAL
jgi:hypothetical protein